MQIAPKDLVVGSLYTYSQTMGPSWPETEPELVMVIDSQASDHGQCIKLMGVLKGEVFNAPATYVKYGTVDGVAVENNITAIKTEIQRLLHELHLLEEM